jgi:hypothetical protein
MDRVKTCEICNQHIEDNTFVFVDHTANDANLHTCIACKDGVKRPYVLQCIEREGEAPAWHELPDMPNHIQLTCVSGFFMGEDTVLESEPEYAEIEAVLERRYHRLHPEGEAR